MTKLLSRAGLLLCVCALAVASPARAQTTYLWTNGTSNALWDTPGNWSSILTPPYASDGPPTATDIALFSNVAIGPITLAAPQTVLYATFDNESGNAVFGGAGLSFATPVSSSFVLRSAAGSNGTSQFNNAVTIGNTSVTANVNGGVAWFTNAGNSLNGLTLAATNGSFVRGTVGTASNSLAASTVSLSGATFQIDATSGLPVTAGLFAREFTGTAYTGAAPTGLGTVSVTTSAPFALATPSNTTVYTNFATTANIQGNNPGSSLPASTVGAIQLAGRFFAPTTGYYQFRTNPDDANQVFIDGVSVVVNDNGHSAQTVIGAGVFLTAGYHALDYQLINSSSGYQFSLDVQGPNATGFTALPASQAFVSQTLSATTTNIVGGAGAALRLNVPDAVGQVNVGALSFTAGGSLAVTSATPGSTTTVRATGTTLANGTQTLNVAGPLVVAGGSLAGGGAGAVLIKAGSGQLVFDNSLVGATNTVVAGSILEVQGGVLLGLGTTGGVDPFGAASLRINGGTVRLDTRYGAPATFNNPILVGAAGGTLEAVPTSLTTTVGSATNGVAFTPNGTLTLNPFAGNNATASTTGATLSILGPLTGDATNQLIVNSAVRNYGVATGTITSQRPFNNALFGTASLNANSPAFAGGIVVNSGLLNALAPVGTTTTVLGTGPVTVNFGRLFLKANGTGSNTTVTFGNNMAITGGLGVGLDVNNNGANTGNNLAFGTLTIDTTAANNPQQFSSITLTNSNTYSLQYNGAATVTGSGSVLYNVSSGTVFFNGGLNAGPAPFTKIGGGSFILGGSSTIGGGLAVFAGNNRVDGTLSTPNIFAVGGGSTVTTIADANTALGAVSAFSNGAGATTITLINGAVLRVDGNRALTALPTLNTAAPLGAPSAAVFGFNVANYTNTLTVPAGQPNLYFGNATATTGQTQQYTGGTIVPNGTAYLIGGSNTATNVLRLTGNGTLPVLADNAGATSLTIGSNLAVLVGTSVNTTRFDSAVGNGYSGGTTINRLYTADVQQQGNAFGSGAVFASGNLTFGGAFGSAVASATTANTNAYSFAPGGTLLFDSTTAPNAGLTAGRWGDFDAIALSGTTLRLNGTSNIATSGETVGAISFDGGSVVTLARAGTGSAALVAADLTRTGRGTLRITATATNGQVGSNLETFTLAAPSIATGGNQNILPGYIVAAENGTALASFVTRPAGSNAALTPLATASYVATLTAATGSDAVDIAATQAPAAGSTAYALRVRAALTGTTGIAVGTGGLVFNTTSASTTGFNFGANEGTVYVANGTTATLTVGASVGGLTTSTGSAGITKFGAGTLSLSSAAGSVAPAFVGNVTINEGVFQNTVATGQTAQPIPNTTAYVLNGGTLNYRLDASATVAAGVTLRGPATIDIDRSGTTATNQTLTFGPLTVGGTGAGEPSAGSYPIQLNLTTGNTYNVKFLATTLNQDLYLNGGRVQFGAVSGAGRTIAVANGTNMFLQSLTNSIGAITVNSGVLVPDQSGTYTLGGPTTLYGAGSFFGGAGSGNTSTFTESFQIYSGAAFNGNASLVFTPAGTNPLTGLANTVTLGNPTGQPASPLTLGLSNSAGLSSNQTNVARFDNPILNTTALTLTGGAVGNTGNIRQLALIQGSNPWNLSGPIDLNSTSPLHFIVNGPTTSGDVAPVLANLTTLRANAGGTFTAGTGNAATQAYFWLSSTTGAATTPRVQFAQTILDSNLQVDAVNSVAGYTVGTVAHISLGNVIVNGDRQLTLFDSINLANTVTGTDYTSITGDAASVLRLTTSGTTAASFLLNKDVSASMLGTVVLSNAAGTGAFTLAASGGMGARGVVGNGTSLTLGVTPTVKDAFTVNTGGIVFGTAAQYSTLTRVTGGITGGQQIAFDRTATIFVTDTTLSPTGLPQGLAGTSPDVILGVGNNLQVTAPITLGGANGLGGLSGDTATRTISSGTFTAAGPFQIQGRGQTIVLGGTVAGNTAVNVLPAANLPSGYRSDVLVLPATNAAFALLLGNNGAGGTAGDLSGVRNFVVTGGAQNVAVTVQPQFINSAGGTGTTKAGILLLYSANNTANTINPGGSAAPAASTLNGSVTIQYGASMTVDDANNITTTSGPITLHRGAVLSFSNLTNSVNAFAGLPASYTAEPGVIARIVSGATAINNLGTAIGANGTVRLQGSATLNPALTFNRDPATPWSGMLTTSASATLSSTGGVSVGTNGAILGAAGGATLTYGGSLTTGGNPLQIGNTQLVDGSQSLGSVTYTGASTFGVSPITIATVGSLSTPRTSLATANTITIDGGLIPTGTAGAANVGALTTTGLATLATTTGASSSLVIDSLGARQNNGVIGLNNPTTGQLGLNEQIIVTNSPPVPANGFLPLTFVNVRDNSYVTYNAGTGFANAAAATIQPIASATATQIGNVTANATVGTAQTIGGLQITGVGGFTLTVNAALTLGTGSILNNTTSSNVISGSGSINGNGGEVVVYDTSNALSINVPITNATGFTKYGGNSVSLGSASNNFGGGLIAIHQGNLRLGVANAFPATSTVYIGAAGTFDLFNFAGNVAGVTGPGTINNTQATNGATQTLTLSGAGNYTFDGIFAATNASTDLNHTGTGTQTFTNNLNSNLRSITNTNGVLNFNGFTTHGNNTASVTANGGTINYNQNIWFNGTMTVNSGATVNFAGQSFVQSGGAALTVNGTGIVNLNGGIGESVLLTGALNVNGGTFNFNNTAAHYLLADANFLQAAAGSNQTVQGSYNVFSGNATFANNGSVTLTGTNTFNSAARFVNAGPLTLNGTSVFNGPTEVRQQATNVSSVTVNGTAQFNQAVSLDLTGVTLGASGQVQFGNAAAIRGGTASLVTTGSGYQILPGTTGLVTIGDSGSTAATLLADVGQTVTRPLASGSGSGTYTLGSAAASGTSSFSGNLALNSPLFVTAATGGTVALSGNIAQPAGQPYSLTKIGGGDLVLSGANSHTGGTVINAGRVRVANVTGSATGTGATQVNATGTLFGSGTAGGNLYVNPNGLVSPGNGVAGIGTLTVGNAATATTVTVNGFYGFNIATTLPGNAAPISDGSTTAPQTLTTGNNLLAVVGTSATAVNFLASTVRLTATDATLGGNWDPTLNYSWTLASLPGGATVNNIGLVAFDTSSFAPSTQAGSVFQLAQGGSGLVLNYVAQPVPEPATVGLIAAGGFAAARLLRRLRRKV